MSANKLNREFSLRLSPIPETGNIAHQKRGVPLRHLVQFQRSLSPHSAQELQSKDRRGWTAQAGAWQRDCEDAPDSTNTFLALPRAWDRRGDQYLSQCLPFFPFSSLNAHCRMVGCNFFGRSPCPASVIPGSSSPNQARFHVCWAHRLRLQCLISAQGRILRQKKSARILTDTEIRRLPDCAIDCRGYILRSWSYLRPSSYPKERNWKCCEGSINSGHGALWMRNVTVWFAARSSPASRLRWLAAHAGTGRCG